MVVQVLSTELLKLRRTKITWLSALAYSVGPAVGGLFLWIIREPERAARLGLIGQKAMFLGRTADWQVYFALLVQMTGVGGVMLLSVLAAYVFGREYSEGTAKNMLVLPVAREWFPIAKLVVLFVWFASLTVLVLAEAFVEVFMPR